MRTHNKHSINLTLYVSLYDDFFQSKLAPAFFFFLSSHFPYREIPIQPVKLRRLHLFEVLLPELLGHLLQGLVRRIRILLQLLVDLLLVAKVRVAGRLDGEFAEAGETAGRGDPHVPRNDTLVKQCISFRLHVFLRKDPFHGDFVAVSVSRHGEIAVAGRHARILIQILLAVQDIALSVLLADIVQAHRAERHRELGVDDDIRAGERAPVDLHSEFAGVFALLDVVDPAHHVPHGERFGTVHGTHYDSDCGQRRA